MIAEGLVTKPFNEEENTETRVNEVRQNFLGWQCRIRQIVMREAGGQPSSGLQPKCISIDGDFLGQVIVLLVRKNANHDAIQLRHIFLATQDPFVRYQNAVKYLSAGYYQRPHEFSHEMTALFDTSMSLPVALMTSGGCLLEFSQYSSIYRFHSSIRALEASEPAYQATYWHNSLFNQRMPTGIKILGFELDWESCQITNN